MPSPKETGRDNLVLGVGTDPDDESSQASSREVLSDDIKSWQALLAAQKHLAERLKEVDPDDQEGGTNE